MRILRSFLIIAITLAVVAYSIACGLLYVNQKRMVYYPVPLSSAPNGELFEINRSDTVLRGWMINPGQSKALLYFGGNAEQVERNAEFLRACVPQYTVYLLPYRGYGGNEGTPDEEAMLADALALYQFAASHQQTISVMGRSLGSGIANYVASQSKVEKSVLVTPYDSIVDVAAEKFPIFPVSLLATERFESHQYASKVFALTKLIVAGRDEVIPAKHAKRLAAHFSSSPQVQLFPEATHNSVSDEQGYQQAVCDFLR
jgi:uncharacterized protein